MTLSTSTRPSVQEALQTFIHAYNQRTQTSKARAQTYRTVLADRRLSDGFCHPLKELVYPIVGHHGEGSRFWDIDQNEYLDLAMGFGTALFGHNPPFIRAAIAERLDCGFALGPQSDLAGEVAQLICDLTKMERVTFCNTGTEAVMTALRLARAATGRQKIAFFSRSYHGHSDGTLLEQGMEAGQPQTIPSALGVPTTLAETTLVLDYGEPSALAEITAHADDLAAVLVEPVQDACPDLQPQAFLQDLRSLTHAKGIALIFDEMLTGFRIHPGGAQAWFGIDADIATYGKIIGGGLPIGVIAGKGTYMDRIDGGAWTFGENSAPTVEKTFFAGTYCKHPLSMAAALAVLTHLKECGPALQQSLNNKTERFISSMNHYFHSEDLPIQLANFGSLFNVISDRTASEKHAPSQALPPERIVFELMNYHLIYRGIYLLSGGGFLSTAHTDADCDRVLEAVRDTVRELRESGLLP
ncbi:MAG TPA: aspartate aminotransferase family protein [Stenomitos sp.]